MKTLFSSRSSFTLGGMHPSRPSALLRILPSLALLWLLYIPAFALVQAPVLKWQHGGAYSSYAELGWYSSPAVADLDGDGYPEVIGANYSVFALDGRTGSLKWRAQTGHDVTEPAASSIGRTWPGVVVADLDGDGNTWIVTAHSGGYVSVYDRTGHFRPGWPWHGAGTNELRSLAVADLDGDGKMEIVVGRAGGAALNTWILEPDGTVRPEWPQPVSTASGYSWGVYNANIALADLDRNGAREVIVPSDVHYICAYNAAGVPLASNPIYGASHALWGLVGVFVNLAYEIQGYGPLDAPDPFRPNFASSPATVADLNGDGKPEVIVAGNVYDYSKDPYLDLYCGPFIFNADRSRFNAGGFDWRTTPAPTGAPLTEDYNIIENAQPNPVTADLDGDGRMEILFPSYDGRLHAFWLDKTEHGQWPYQVYHASDGFFRFASEPVVADLDGDGRPEVIFASWTQKGSGSNGRLHVVDAQGNKLYEIELPASFGGGDWNGALATPTLADIDGDGELEVLLNTAHAGIVAYDLPGAAVARSRVLWGTGRGNYQRTGAGALDTRTAAREWRGY